MTDINEIIGRALLTFKNEDDHPLVSEDLGGYLFIEGDLNFTDIGAAVVKALGEAGYEVVPDRKTYDQWLRSILESNPEIKVEDLRIEAYDDTKRRWAQATHLPTGRVWHWKRPPENG